MMKNYRRNILSLACGLGAAAVLAGSVLAQEKIDHPGTTGEDVRYRGAPIPAPGPEAGGYSRRAGS